MRADNTDITGLADLAGKTVATQQNSTGVTLLESEELMCEENEPTLWKEPTYQPGR